MTEPNRPSAPGGGGGFRSPVSLRTGAILLMVAGAAGFVAARLLFGDQVLCLLVSTLVVFAGLGLIIYGRRSMAGEDQSTAYGQRPLHGQHPLHDQRPLPPAGAARDTGSARVNPRQIPRGLREAARQQGARPPDMPRTLPQATPNIPPAPPEQWAARTNPMPPSRPEPEPVQAGNNALLDAVITAFENQGARVDIETQRDERGILTIQAPDGLLYTSLVLETPGQVDVAEVRALYALMTSSGSVGGYLISDAGFSQRAYDWAGQHRIHLVTSDEIDELGI